MKSQKTPIVSENKKSVKHLSQYFFLFFTLHKTLQHAFSLEFQDAAVWTKTKAKKVYITKWKDACSVIFKK